MEDEDDGQDLEIKQEFREQTLYEVMKSHLIPDNKMEEIDQDNVIENTSPFGDNI